MRNLSKADLLAGIRQSLILCGLQPDAQTVSNLFSQAFVVPDQAEGDRMLLCGYTLLLDHTIRFDAFLSADQLLDEEFLVPCSALERFYEELLLSRGMDEQEARHNAVFLSNMGRTDAVRKNRSLFF